MTLHPDAAKASVRHPPFSVLPEGSKPLAGGRAAAQPPVPPPIKTEVVQALIAAGWRPADALGIRSSARLVIDTVLDKPDPNAPVSDLYVFGRKEDLAFEKPVDHSPKERHHVRFWRSEQLDNGRPLWMGAATHDTGVELSRTTAEVTHHISPDVDAERDLILADLQAANVLRGTRWISGFHKELHGHNGGGDPWHTDGRLPVAAISIMPVQ